MSSIIKREINAKLLFYCGAMGNGKTTHLISTWFAYMNANFNTVVFKPSDDVKGDTKVIARNGQSIETDYLIAFDTDIFDLVKTYFKNADVIIIDEAQFLMKHHIDELARLVYEENKIVICYGLLTDYREDLFEGSRRLIEVGAEIEKINIPCECGRDRTHNLRLVNGEAVFDGEQILIDGTNAEVKYKSMCGSCFNKRRSLSLKKKIDSSQFVIPGFED